MVFFIYALLLGGEVWLPLLEEAGFLALEWAHKLLDVLYESVFGFGHELAARASAWTGLFLILGLIGWAGYALRVQYLRFKANGPAWWAGRKAALSAKWKALPWFHKLAYVVGYLGLVLLLAVLI
ncbi:MAG: hypothetical protein ACKN9T_18510 [Candidatus Methylumidiphilus sp.]